MNFCLTVGLLAVTLLRIDADTSASHEETTPVSPANATSGDGQDHSSSKLIEYIDLKQQQKGGLATVEFDDVTYNNITTEAHRKFPGVVVTILNSAKPVQFRRRRREAGRYNEDGIILIQIEPAVLNERLRISFAAQDQDGNVLRANTLEQILKSSTDTINSQMNLKVHSVYAGLPKDVREAIIAANRRPTVWDEHWKMFIVVAIVVAIAFVTLIICLLCFYCCQSKQDGSHAKVELSPTKQPPVQDMIEVSPVVPLQYAPISQQSPSTNEASPLIEEENGWIVPIDQLSPEELEQPDIQISKL